MRDEPDVSGLDDLDRVDELIDDVLADRAADTGGGTDATTSSLLRLKAMGDEPVPSEVRTRHLARIRTYEAGGPVTGTRATRSSPRWNRVPRRRLVPVMAAALSLMMIAGGGTVALAQDATPDDALYGIKRASEQAWSALPRGTDGAAEVHLALAERRLDEARRAPRHAERLIGEGAESVEAAADDRPDEAIDNFVRLLGDGPDRLPDNASPMARSRIHRNCVRIATKHDLGPERCGAAPDDVAPGRGLGQGLGEDGVPGQGRGLGRPEGAETRGWGPGGRPDGETGPPHGMEVPRGNGWGPGGRPDGETGPPHGMDVPRGDGEPSSPGSDLEPVPDSGS